MDYCVHSCDSVRNVSSAEQIPVQPFDVLSRQKIPIGANARPLKHPKRMSFR